MDLPNSLPASEISSKLELEKTKQTYAIFASNALEMQGVTEGLDWLTQELKRIS